MKPLPENIAVAFPEAVIPGHFQGIVYVANMQTYELLYTNAYTEQLFGSPQGKKCHELIHQSDTPCTLCPNKRLVDFKGQPRGIYEWEYLNERNNRWYLAQNKAFIDANNRLLRYEIAFDSTDRKKDEKSLLKLLYNQKVLYEVSETFNVLSDFEKRMLHSLEILCSYTQADKSSILEIKPNHTIGYSYTYPENPENTVPVSFELNPWLLEEMSLVFSGHPFVELSDVPDKAQHYTCFTFLSGSLPYPRNAIFPIMVDNRLFGLLLLEGLSQQQRWTSWESDLMKTYCFILSNSIKRKQAEDEIVNRRKELEALNKTKDKLFSIIAHDLKNPFNTIIGFSELLKKVLSGNENPKPLKYTEFIYDASKNAYYLLENLLEWSRSQSNRLNFEPARVDLVRTIESNLKFVAELAINKEIVLKYEDTGTTIVYCDPNMLNVVMRNLLTNAIKFTPKNGQISISCSTKGNFIATSVTDTGIGMTPEQVNNLFVLNTSSSNTGTEGERGTGLGLVLCQEFITKNNGMIWAESTPGLGSTFTFTLPAWRE